MGGAPILYGLRITALLPCTRAARTAGAWSHDAHGQIRWYNPTLEDFEWRALPTTDEQALSLLEGSPYSATCTQTYREWRQLGAAIGAALMRAGEAAKQQSENQKREDDAS